MMAESRETMQPSSSKAPPEESSITITIVHHGTPHTFPFSPSSTVVDLSNAIHANLAIPSENQKFMITPKLGILKPPFATIPLTSLLSKKIILLAPTPSELSSLQAASSARSSSRPSVLKPVAPSRNRDWRKAQDEATYTFHSIVPLSYLPEPSRSQRFLERLRDDAGIKASMRKHQFSVGILTEMNPADHTTHESRTLGLNRNRGEVIELRLRTDAYDGYRDYKVIRNTLCHELAHNVFGEHDKDFWALTRDIEKEVSANDWRSGGQALSNQHFYDPGDHGLDGEHVDSGGWTGGEFVVGGASGNGINRREAMAKAAEERMKKQRDAGKGGMKE